MAVALALLIIERIVLGFRKHGAMGDSMLQFLRLTLLYLLIALSVLSCPALAQAACIQGWVPTPNGSCMPAGGTVCASGNYCWPGQHCVSENSCLPVIAGGPACGGSVCRPAEQCVPCAYGACCDDPRSRPIPAGPSRREQATSSPSHPGRHVPAADSGARIALVITNQAYTQPGAKLTNTYNDGAVIRAALETVGFKVWLVKDTNNERALLQAVAEHVQRMAEAGPNAVGFLYYSGHGAADRPNGENFLIPTDVPLTHTSQLPLLAVRLEKITSTLASAGRMSFVVFDACRNVPLLRETKDLTFKGLAPVREQNGLLVAFATEPGNVAVDESLYAKALADAIVTPGLEAGQVFRRARLRVREATGQRQLPEYIDKRDRDFNFVLSAGPQ
jgi:hypothetical protein